VNYKKPALTILALGLALYAFVEQNPGVFNWPESNGSAGTDQLGKAFENRQSDVQVRGEGEVIRILRDDSTGSRHQKFILRLPSGQTLLIAHNIDLAPRINDLQRGDTVAFFGEYEWDEKGGVVHWTHHDPGGRHEDGWLEHQGKTYQ
jgi:hypothetical protein